MLFLEIIGLVPVWAAAVSQLWQFSHCYLPEMSWQKRGHSQKRQKLNAVGLHSNKEHQHCPCCTLQPTAKAV